MNYVLIVTEHELRNKRWHKTDHYAAAFYNYEYLDEHRERLITLTMSPGNLLRDRPLAYEYNGYSLGGVTNPCTMTGTTKPFVQGD